MSRAVIAVILVLSCALSVSCGGKPRTLAGASAAGGPPDNGPVGWDAFRQLDRLPEIPVGVHEYEISSYDRTGGNNDGFTGSYSCLSVSRDGCVIAQHRGPGEVDSIWFTRDGGDVAATGAIKVVLDGRTALDAPLQLVVDGHAGAPFIYPLVANAQQSSGGVYIAVPMPFRTEMRITTERNPRFYHVFYRTFGTSRGVSTFDPSERALDVISKLRAAGFVDPKPALADARTTSSSLRLKPGRALTVADLEGPGEVSALRLHLPQLASASAATNILHNVRLVISFDGHRTVDSPLGEFFGSGLGEARVHALMFSLADGSLTSWWPMPYARSVRVALVNQSGQAVAGSAAVVWSRSPQWARELSSGRVGYFATSSHAGPTTPGVDWPFLRIRGAGKLVGISQTMAGPDRSYLEGDDIGFVDGARQLHGTGTEDFYEGGWYWNRGPFSDPFNGEPSHEASVYGCFAVCDSAYRLMIADSIPFSSAIDYGIEHGNRNTVPALYGSTAFWYEPIAK